MSHEDEHYVKQASVLKTWVVVAFFLVFILGKGFLAFYVIGDRGQPSWDYRPIADVPAESPYATYRLLPYGQHVRGAKGE